jgi:hypothetical protein
VTTMLETPKDDKFRRKYLEATLRRNLAEKSDEEKRRHEKTAVLTSSSQSYCGGIPSESNAVKRGQIRKGGLRQMANIDLKRN